ncbi:glyoxylase-like metal-dependent hydrolase (beta-lactamase superfamily II) [Alicyclobacillus sacchari]|uniref:Glyoxylase-like metal-dependent hydrolase (Beta-lactamase superfamily II) n=1 Tax=Alicyclobacillus sacchari TaxID=392010 RepID=A0A4V3HEB7_9BACL|nr:MBL fold metallo-hydrolase [Alicyclobacillus sacchari]TDY46238.1 glyoxylase-like metal-dependent hydrolase (beta-lactamase superfamily II) [Alicyclobacillus sacchari]GMA57279.1 hydrolase [Alicyclobacillus sacchari]
MEIAPHVHLLECTKGSYCYLVLRQEPVLIDTGMPGRGGEIVSALAKLGMRPDDLAHIVLTHQDVDHIGNAKYLKEISGATLWAPADDIPYIHGDERAPGIRRLIGRMMRVDRPRIDEVLDPGRHVGDLEIIPTPGHTPGHVCLRMGDVLLAGDLVTTRGGRLKKSPGMLTWDKAALKRSLHEVGKLPFDWVCPAHGEPVRRGSLWEALLE